MIKQRPVPVAIAIAVGLLTLVGLLLPVPEITNLILGWAAFVAAVALILGVLNLFSVHFSRLFKQRNLYSGVLVLSMLAVFTIALTDSPLLNLTDNGLEKVFNWIQFPLEAALASMLAIFLLVAGFRLWQRQRNLGSGLFLLTIIVILIINALLSTQILPATMTAVFDRARQIINDLIVTAGMRGILIGVALGTITISLRLLIGVDRPYNK